MSKSPRMSKTARIILIAMVAVTVLVVATVGAAAATVYRAGTIAVRVDDNNGDRIAVTVPAGLARIAIAAIPASVLGEALDELDELDPWMPAARAGWTELAEAPDFVLVEVQGRNESVIVRKQGRQLVVHVDSPDARVDVTVPLGTVGALLAKLDRARLS